MLGRALTRFAIVLGFAGVAAVPSLASAQIGGGIGGRTGGRGGGMGGGMGGMGRGGMQGMRSREEPIINSVDLILRHFHDLALSDSQVTQLTVVKARQDSLVVPIRAKLDSLAPAHGRDAGGEIIDGEQGDKLLARRDAMKKYRDVLKQSRTEAFALLAKKQRKQAEKLESDVKKELQSDGAGRGRMDPFGDRGNLRGG